MTDEEVFGNERIDSYSQKMSNNATLKVYLDFNDLPSCELRLKNFYKIKKFIHALEGLH